MAHNQCNVTEHTLHVGFCFSMCVRVYFCVHRPIRFCLCACRPFYVYYMSVFVWVSHDSEDAGEGAGGWTVGCSQGERWLTVRLANQNKDKIAPEKAGKRRCLICRLITSAGEGKGERLSNNGEWRMDQKLKYCEEDEEEGSMQRMEEWRRGQDKKIRRGLWRFQDEEHDEEYGEMKNMMKNTIYWDYNWWCKGTIRRRRSPGYKRAEAVN